jgi:hypothetical protein
MKKAMVLLVFMACIGQFAMAQMDGSSSAMRERMTFGLKAGVNYSNVYDSKGEEFSADPKWGVAAGWFAAIPIGQYLGLQPELLVSQKGFKASGRLFGSTYDFTRTTTYLDVPIMVSLKPSEFFSIMAGPQYSYLIRQKDVFTSTAMSFEQETEFKNDNIRKNTFCFLGGVDFLVDHIVISLRAGWDIQNNTGDGSAVTPRYKNVWYQSTIGYRF